MNGSSQGWARWEEATGFKSRVQQLVEKHLNNARLAASEYLAGRRARLSHELEDKQIIYLDTKHWVNLCNVVVQSPQAGPAYDQILGLLELLRRKGRICCPISATLFLELMKQDDPSTRQSTARLMDFLSGGVCLQNWLNLAKAEFGRHICRTLHNAQVDETEFPTWTKIGYWSGEHRIEFPNEVVINSAVMEKVYIDLRWEMTCDEYQSMPGWIPIPDSFAVAWIAESEQAKARQAQTGLSFHKLARARRAQLLQALKETLFPMLALCRNAPGTANDHVAAVLDPIYEARDPQALPLLEIVAGLDAVVQLDTKRKVQANDLEDYLHAAQALPYCDAFFCDNFMSQKLRSKQLEFGRVYKTEIGSRPEEIVA
jgi:hypothetical protein